MAGRTGRYPFKDFTGGEAHNFPYTAMPSKFSMLLQNCYISEKGTVKKVPGYAKVNTGGSAAVNLTSGFEYLQKDGTSIKLVAGGGSIFKITGTTLTAIKTGLDNGSRVNFSVMSDLCQFSNGVDAPLKYDGTTVAALGGTPPATAFKFHTHKNRSWAIERANKLLATHSDLNNVEAYTGGASGYIDFQYVLKRGDALIDLGTYVDLILYLFRNHLAIYSGMTPSGSSSDFALVQLIEGIGAVDTNASIGLGSDHLILHESGLKRLRQVVTTGNVNTGDVSEQIDPIIQASMAGGVSQNYCLAHVPLKKWLLMLIGNRVWVYAYQWKAWSRIETPDVNFIFTTRDGEIYLCGNNYVYKMDDALGTFDGANVEMKWQTAWLPISRDGRYIYPKILEISLRSDTKPVTLTITGNTESSVASPFTVTGTLLSGVTDFDSLSPLSEDVYDHVRVPLFGRGRQMMLQISNTSNIAGLEICDLVIQATAGGF